MPYYIGVPHPTTENWTIYFQGNDFFEFETTIGYKSSSLPRWSTKTLLTQMARPPWLARYTSAVIWIDRATCAPSSGGKHNCRNSLYWRLYLPQAEGYWIYELWNCLSRDTSRGSLAGWQNWPRCTPQCITNLFRTKGFIFVTDCSKLSLFTQNYPHI